MISGLVSPEYDSPSKSVSWTGEGIRCPPEGIKVDDDVSSTLLYGAFNWYQGGDKK